MITPEALTPLVEYLSLAPIAIALFRTHRVHIIPRYKGGTDDDSNVVPGVPIPWHALQHKIMGEELQGKDGAVNRSAVGILVHNMSPEERTEFARLSELHERDRGVK